jgi:hypothetical protein
MNNPKILNRLNQLEILAGLVIKEATMLKQELSGVVSDNSTRKGKGLSEAETSKLLMRREKSRLGIK